MVHRRSKKGLNMGNTFYYSLHHLSLIIHYPTPFARRKTTFSTSEKGEKGSKYSSHYGGWWLLFNLRHDEGFSPDVLRTTQQPCQTLQDKRPARLLFLVFLSRKHKSTKRYYSPGLERVGEKMDETIKSSIPFCGKKKELVISLIRWSLETSPPREMTVRKLHLRGNSDPNPRTRTSERVSRRTWTLFPSYSEWRSLESCKGSAATITSTGRESRRDVHAVMTLTLRRQRGDRGEEAIV